MSEDCLSAAHLKAQEREQELQDLRREKRKCKGTEETGWRRSAERHLYEEVDKGVESRKTKKKRSKKPEGLKNNLYTVHTCTCTCKQSNLSSQLMILFRNQTTHITQHELIHVLQMYIGSLYVWYHFMYIHMYACTW